MNPINKIRFFFYFKHILKVFIFSFIWLSTPIMLFYVPELKSEISYNESYLTPYSVSVSGYSRSDGSYVKPYKRRPPGSVSHDKPYENKITSLRVKIKFIYIFFTVSFLLFLFYLYKKIINSKELFENYIHTQIISKLNFDFNSISNKPPNLINRLISRYSSSKTYYCVYCKRSIGKEEFHHSNLSKSSPKKTCFNCMVKMELKFMYELGYIENFKSKLNLYISEYKKISEIYFRGYQINEFSIEKHFYKKVKENRIKKVV